MSPARAGARDGRAARYAAAMSSPRLDVAVAVPYLKKTCPDLARVIAAVGPCTLTRSRKGTLYDALVRSIIYQQLAGAAAATIHGRLLARFGGQTPEPREILTTADADLRAVGLSPQKLGYLRDLAARVAEGEVRFDHLPRRRDDEVIAELTKIKGVGEWTVQMLLMFRLGRGDILPIKDLGIQKGLQRTFRLRKHPTPAKVAELGARWAPHRTVASWYLWRSLEIEP